MKKYLCILMAALLVTFSLSSCNNDTTDETQTETESMDEVIDSTQTETETDASEVTYTVTVRSTGGTPFARLNFVVFKGEQILKHSLTDEQGTATVSLPADNGYTLKFISKLPDGYVAQESYPLKNILTEIVLSSTVLPGPAPVGTTYRVGDIVHDFTLTNVDGQEIILSELLKEKKAVMLNFWFTTCQPCKKEFPHMQAAYTAQNGVEILAINDVGDTTNSIKTYRDDLGLTFPVINTERSFGLSYGVMYYPTTIIIDRYGMICFMHVGGLTEAQFAKTFAYFSAETYTQTVFDNIDEIPEINP